jgi:hypothetical protein
MTETTATTTIDPRYLEDVTGKLPTIAIGDYLEKNGLLAAMPDFVQDAYKRASDALADDAHQYGCNLDKEATSGQKNSCGQSKAWNAYAGQLAVANRPYILEIEYVSSFPFRHIASKKGVQIAKPVSRNNANLRGVDGRYKRVRAKQQRQRYHVGIVNTALNKNEAQEIDQFREAVDGKEGSTIGQKALFYDINGRPLRGTGAIARQAKETQLSASTAVLNQSVGTSAGATPTAAPQLKAGSHPNKKKAGETKGNFAVGLGTIALIAVGLAALLPMHFVTSAITFINSLVSFFTTTRNAVATYTAILDSALSLFGIKGATKGFSDILNGMIDNAFGKENVQEAKANFAKTLNSVSSSVKLAEKIQQARSNTDNKVDAMAIQLGIVNNGMKDSGLLPPDSPYMKQSQDIDKFIESRSTGEGADPDLADNLKDITGEIKTGEKITQELKDEKERQDKAQRKTNKQIDDVSKLVDKTKTNIEAVKPGDL